MPLPNFANRLRFLAPYVLLISPALLWLLLCRGEHAGLFSQHVLLMICVYLAFGAAAFWLGRSNVGGAALISGLVLMAIMHIEHDPPAQSQYLAKTVDFCPEDLADDYDMLLSDALVFACSSSIELKCYRIDAFGESITEPLFQKITSKRKG